MKARVRLLRDHPCLNIAPGQEKTFRAGEEHVLAWWVPRWSQSGRRTEGIWGTSYDIDEAWLVPEDAVEVLEVLEP